MSTTATSNLIRPERPIAMISPPGEDGRSEFYYVTLPRVIQDKSGFYVGSLRCHFAGGLKGVVEPDSRDSGTFTTEAAAVQCWEDHFRTSSNAKIKIEVFNRDHDYTQFLTPEQHEALAAEMELVAQDKAKSDQARADANRASEVYNP